MSPKVSEPKFDWIQRWKQDWEHSPDLREKFPSQATYLVYRASECLEFQKLRKRHPLPAVVAGT